MKKYTLHFLIFTLLTAILGFSGLEFIGDTAVRFSCLLSAIGLMVSCADAVILSRRVKRFKKRTQKVPVNNK